MRLKDRVPRNEMSGVYRIDCNGVYIGQTGRQLKIRVAEHMKAWEKNNEGESAFADHLIASGHRIREGSEVLLHRENAYFKRIALENIEIIRHGNGGDVNLLNRYVPEEGVIDLIYEPCVGGSDFS